MVIAENFSHSFWDNFSWDRARALLSADPKYLASTFRLARERTIQSFGPTIKLFLPGSKFPSISVTGNQCALDCLHCNKRYLKHMRHTSTPEDLIALCSQLDDQGAVGCLISGGCNEDGSVPLGPFLDAIAAIKAETRLVLNLHTGFLTPEIAARLETIGVDVVSFDVNGSSETVKEIYGLNREVVDYKQSLDLLTEHHINFVPHICIGLHYGLLKGEVDALELLSQYLPSSIVLIVLIPPSSGPNQSKFAVPSLSNVAKIFCIARAAFPETELLLGCMRPGGVIRHAIEQSAINAGATSVVKPTRETRNWLATKQIPTTIYNACCAIPSNLYDKAIGEG